SALTGISAAIADAADSAATAVAKTTTFFIVSPFSLLGSFPRPAHHCAAWDDPLWTGSKTDPTHQIRTQINPDNHAFRKQKTLASDAFLGFRPRNLRKDGPSCI